MFFLVKFEIVFILILHMTPWSLIYSSFRASLIAYAPLIRPCLISEQLGLIFQEEVYFR